VQLITEEQYTIAKAAKRLGIKASTARMILNKYKQTGDFPMKQFKRASKITPRNSRTPLKEITLPFNEEENMSP
jgi:transposase